MKDKATVRYMGYRTLPDGGRGFDLSIAVAGTHANMITIEASAGLFTGPDRIAIQEGAASAMKRCGPALRRIPRFPTMHSA